MRAKACEAATKAAAQTYDFNEAGQLTRVTDPRAVAVLRRAFTTMIRQGRPLSFQLSEAEAAAFPRWTGRSAGMVHALAVWIDAGGHCAYAIRSVAAVDLMTGEPREMVAAEVAETAARKRLAEITRYGGFPIAVRNARSGRDTPGLRGKSASEGRA